MSNGDSSGERLRKQQATTLQTSLATALQNYVGDQNGRLDLVSKLKDAADEARALQVST